MWFCASMFLSTVQAAVRKYVSFSRQLRKSIVQAVYGPGTERLNPPLWCLGSQLMIGLREPREASSVISLAGRVASMMASSWTLERLGTTWGATLARVSCRGS
jgi:hypothetical protein